MCVNGLFMLSVRLSDNSSLLAFRLWGRQKLHVDFNGVSVGRSVSQTLMSFKDQLFAFVTFLSGLKGLFWWPVLDSSAGFFDGLENRYQSSEQIPCTLYRCGQPIKSHKTGVSIRSLYFRMSVTPLGQHLSLHTSREWQCLPIHHFSIL